VSTAGARQHGCRTGLWPFLGGTCHAGTSMVYGILYGYDHDDQAGGTYAQEAGHSPPRHLSRCSSPP
jgi:hypothetical protein